MKKTSTTIVFFGSGPVAAESLALLAEDFDIEAVVTKPRPAHHKGDFPVLLLAEKLGLKTFTPTNKQELADLFLTKPVASQLGVVIDYGIIIDQSVINYFPLGIINSHFSLLPEWRGADPISFAILSGQSRTGVSLMLIVEELDEGPLLAQAEWPIQPTSTTPTLTADLINLSHTLLQEILPLYIDGAIQPADQSAATIADSKEPTYSRKLTKDDNILDWSKPAEDLEREIRAYISWPKSRTSLAGKEVIVTAAHVSPDTKHTLPGSAFITDQKKLAVATGQDLLIIDRLKPAGKPEMTAQAFLAGHNL